MAQIATIVELGAVRALATAIELGDDLLAEVALTGLEHIVRDREEAPSPGNELPHLRVCLEAGLQAVLGRLVSANPPNALRPRALTILARIDAHAWIHGLLTLH